MRYFSANLKYLREKKGLKQSEMKAVLGFSQTQWGNYETGLSKPSLDDFYKISKFFGISEADILNVSLEKQDQQPEKGRGNANVKKYDFTEKKLSQVKESEPLAYDIASLEARVSKLEELVRKSLGK